LLTLILY